MRRTPEDFLIYLRENPGTERLVLTIEEWRSLRLNLFGPTVGFSWAAAGNVPPPIDFGYIGDLYGVPCFVEKEDAFIRMARELVEADG